MSNDLLTWATGLLVTFVWLAIVLFAIQLAGMNRRTARTPPPRPPTQPGTDGEEQP